MVNLLSQLPPPYILAGDFNAKHIVWGGSLTDDRGALVYDVFADFGLILLTTGAYTHLCLGLGASYALDLTFRSPGIAVHFDWSVLPDLRGSGYYPVKLHMITPSPTMSIPPKWITEHVEWAGVSQSLIFEDEVFPSGTVWWSISRAVYSGPLRNISFSRPPFIVADSSRGGRRNVTTHFALGDEL
jgi:hypothetical protein